MPKIILRLSALLGAFGLSATYALLIPILNNDNANKYFYYKSQIDLVVGFSIFGLTSAIIFENSNFRNKNAKIIIGFMLISVIISLVMCFYRSYNFTIMALSIFTIFASYVRVYLFINDKNSIRILIDAISVFSGLVALILNSDIDRILFSGYACYLIYIYAFADNIIKNSAHKTDKINGDMKAILLLAASNWLWTIAINLPISNLTQSEYLYTSDGFTKTQMANIYMMITIITMVIGVAHNYMAVHLSENKYFTKIGLRIILGVYALFAFIFADIKYFAINIVLSILMSKYFFSYCYINKNKIYFILNPVIGLIIYYGQINAYPNFFHINPLFSLGGAAAALILVDILKDLIRALDVV